MERIKGISKNLILTSQFILIVGFLNAQNLSEKERRRAEEAIDLQNKIGWNFVEKKNDSSLVVLKKALEFSKQISYERGLADSHKSLGVYYKNHSDFEKSQFHLFAALTYYEKHNSLSELSACYNNIGNVYFELNNYEKALYYYSKSYEISLELKQYYQLGNTCNNMGAIYLETQNFQRALEFFDKGLKYVDSANHPNSYANLLLNKGGALLDLKKVKEANVLFQDALSFYKRHQLTYGLCAAYFDIGYAYEANGSHKEALNYYHQSVKLAKEHNFLTLMEKPLEGLMLVHNQLLNEDSVEHYYFELAEVNDLLYKQKTEKNIHDVETKYQTEKKEQALILEKERREKAEVINEVNKRTITMLSVAVAFALALILGVWAYQTQKQQIIQLRLKQKNDEIEKLISEQRVKSYESQLEGETLERKRIASELHDRVGGLLATLNLQFEVLTEKKELLEDGLRIQQLIKASIEEVRTISHNLHGIGQTNSLYKSLDQLKDGITSSGKIEMNLFYEIGEHVVSESISSELYKIVQELTTNTLKHAKAKKITVQLSVIENMLHLIYDDDGTGFDVMSSKKGLGIINVAERVEKCNGTWHIDSKVGRGTTVIINIPVE